MESFVTQNVMHASLCHKTSVCGDEETGGGDRRTWEWRDR